MQLVATEAAEAKRNPPIAIHRVTAATRRRLPFFCVGCYAGAMVTTPTTPTTPDKPSKPSKRKPKPPKRNPNKKPALYVIHRAIDLGIREVAVAVSGGKDSIATLDLCHEYFDRVEAYFMYLVSGLSFQERYLRYIEHRYNLTIHRVPHWALSRMFRDCVFRHETKQAANIKLVRVKDVETYIRRKLNVNWIATGEKVYDSMERRIQIVQADGVNHSRHRIWPIGWWTHYDVFSYLNRKDVLPSPEYKITTDGKSFGSLWAQQILPIAENYPEDYARIRKVFPLIDAQIQRFRQLQTRQNRKDENSRGEESQQVGETGRQSSDTGTDTETDGETAEPEN